MVTGAVGTDDPVRADVAAGPPERSTPSRVLLGVGILVLYLIPAVVAYWRSWQHPTTVTISAGGGDSALFVWGLRWAPWAIAHGHNPFVTHIINVPFGVDLADNTVVLALGVIFAPVTAIWGPIATLNVCFTLAFALSAGAAYLLIRRFVTWRPAAFAGGLLYGYSPYMVGQGLGHLHLVFVAVPPLILLVVHELLVRQSGSTRRWGVVLGLLVVLQYLISSEILATTVMFTVLSVVVVAVANPRGVRPRLGPAVRGLVTGAVVAIVLLAFPIYEQLLGPAHPSGPIIGFAYYYSGLAAPLLPTPLMVLGTHHLKAMGLLIGGNNSENGTYLGFPLVVLLVVAMVLVRRRAVRLAGVMAVIAFVLSLGVKVHTGLARFPGTFTGPANLINKVPLLNQAFPVRYSLFVALFAAVILGMTIDFLRHPPVTGRHAPGSAATGRGRAVVLPAVVAVVVLLPLLPAWPYATQGRASVPAYFTTAAVDRIPAGSVALVYPMAVNTDSSAELWQAEANLRFAMPGGYFEVPATTRGGSPQFFTPTLVQATLTGLSTGVAPKRTPQLRHALRAELRSWGVTSVVAQPVGPHAVGFFTWLVGRAPDASAGGMVEWYRTTWT
jgi:hypothetical protein